MPQFTTQITNAAVIAELPDVSILASLYDDALTLDALVASMNSVSYRKKLQALLLFTMSPTSVTTVTTALKTSYIAYEQSLGKTVTQSGSDVFVNNRLVAFYVDGFADGVFEDATFADLFFTTQVMDAIFSSGDNAFISALVKVSNFWDKLVIRTAVFAHVEANHLAVLLPYIYTLETPYVKYVTAKAGLEVAKYKNSTFLAEDATAMDSIFTTPAAKAIESDSSIGMKARLMYMFNNSSIATIAASSANITMLQNDSALRNVVVDIDAVLVLPVASLMRKFVIDNDGYLGMVASKRLGLSTSVNLSNIFFDETYASTLTKFVLDDQLVALLFESALYPTFASKFYAAFSATNVTGQKYAWFINTAASSAVMAYTNTSFQAKKITLALTSFTETKAATVAAITTVQPLFSVPYVFSDSTIFGVQIDHGIEFTNANNYNLYNEFSESLFNTVIGADGHFIGVKTDGSIVSSKFVTALNLSTETIVNMSVFPEQAFIKTAQTIHVIGNFGPDRSEIVTNILVNKSSIAELVYFNGKVLARTTSGEISEISATGIAPLAGTVGIVASNIFVIKGRMLILTSAGILKELSADFTTMSDIATAVTAPSYAQEAIVAKVNGLWRAIFHNGTSWLKYDFNVNAL